jgi:AcrR family transcriptional regulator
MTKVQLLTPKQQGRRHRILTVAREMLTEVGYQGTVMSKVAQRADVSPTTLYNLYNTKDELLLEALRELTLEAIEKTREEVDGYGYQFILRNMHNSASQSRNGPAYAEAISQAVFRAKPGDPLVQLMLKALSDGILVSLSAMQGRKELAKNTSIRELANTMAGTFWATFLLWTKGRIKLPDLERYLLRGFLSNLIPASRGSAREYLQSRYDELDEVD